VFCVCEKWFDIWLSVPLFIALGYSDMAANNSQQREVYEKKSVDGFRVQRVESLALCQSEKRVFAGTVDGTLIVFSGTNLFDNPGSYSLLLLSFVVFVMKCRG
jgi:hypothetical protein